ncbi:MAG: hypothetical protein NC926_00880 [Candidatus Omnitrophica bacterium]|nr:hypothetical protein [Candidatus Omnitrophota bacterium]
MKRNFFYFISSFLLTLIFRIPYIFPYFSNVDEPEYALVAYKISKGRQIYREIFENKGFGLGYIYYFFLKIFKENYLLAVHLFYLFILFVNTFLIFKIVEKYSNKKASFFSLIFYPVLSTLFYPVDVHKGPEFIIVFLVLLSWFLILFSQNYFSIFLSSILVGLSLFLKQFGILLIFSFVFLVFLKTKNLTKTIVGFVFCFIPFISFLAYLFQKNIIYEWIEWNIKYPLFLTSSVNVIKKIYFIFPMITRIYFLNPFLLIFGINFFRNKNEKVKDLLILLFITFLWGAIHGLPFPHHYVPLLTLSIIVGIIGYGNFISKQEKTKILNILIFFSILQSVFYWHGLDYYKRWICFIKNREWKKEFEIQKYSEIIDYIEKNTKKDDKIIVWGFNPKIYLLSNREPGTRFIILDPVIGENFVHPPSIHQYQPALNIFLQELEIYNIRLFIDATDNSLINMSFYKIEKYPKIKKYLDKRFTFDREIDNFKIYKRKK